MRPSTIAIPPPRSAPPTRLRDRLRALFEEAWARRARRRRRLSIAAVILLVVAAGAVIAARHHDPATVPQRVPAASPATVLSLTRAPDIGVACPGAPNSIACDRVGIAVWLATAPTRLIATIGDRSVGLHDMHIARCASRRPCERFYTGYLQPAGLLHGALEVRPDQGRYHWYGRHPVTGTLRLRATYPRGKRAETTRRVALGPGWG